MMELPHNSSKALDNNRRSQYNLRKKDYNKIRDWY